jgi:hypothetical protein
MSLREEEFEEDLDGASLGNLLNFSPGSESESLGSEHDL